MGVCHSSSFTNEVVAREDPACPTGVAESFNIKAGPRTAALLSSTFANVGDLVGWEDEIHKKTFHLHHTDACK